MHRNLVYAGICRRKEFAYSIQQEHGDIPHLAYTLFTSNDVADLEANGFRLCRKWPVLLAQDPLPYELIKMDDAVEFAFVPFKNRLGNEYQLLFIRGRSPARVEPMPAKENNKKKNSNNPFSTLTRDELL